MTVHYAVEMTSSEAPAIGTPPTLTALSSMTDLERARAHLAAIVASSEDAIVSKTLEGVITSWNQAAERLFGFSSAEMVGHAVLRIIPPELHYEEVDILARLRRGERIERYETVRVRKDGRRVSVSLTVSPVFDASGRIVGAAKIAHDISDRLRAEAALRERETELKQAVAERERFLESERIARSEAERLGHLKDEFLATLSHELRTPLNAIQGWATLLSNPKLSEADRKHGMDVIRRNVRAQAQIVSDLLDMSRIISGKVNLEVQPVQLQEVISHALDAIRQSAAAKEIRLHTLLDSTVGLVRGDPNRLQQVLWNLLSNAVKFTPRDGRIQIVLERVNSHIDIVIEDSGVGIKPDFLPYVFDRFRQEDGSLTRRHGGLGLGLSIVRNLVELHGGSVRVKSAGENLGSTFVVSLPVPHARSDDETRFQHLTINADHLDAVELPRLDDVAVLLVDDEADGRTLLARILEARGARISCAVTAAEALQLMETQRFDILLSDIGMPDMDGYELMRCVRSLASFRSHPIPAIAVTAYARSEDRQRSLLAGYHMHLSKPIDARELVAGVASLVHLRR